MQKNNKMIKTDLKVKDILKVADLMFCIPFAEPHSYTVLEALTFNVPCFVSNTGWLNYEFKNFPEFLLNKISPENISNTIIEFYKNKNKYMEKNKKVKDKLLKKYDYDKCIKGYLKLFNELKS